MNITQTRSEGLTQEFNICIAAQDVKKKLDEHLQSLSKKVKISGFRPGKIPLSILQQKYGASAKHEVFDTIIQDAVNHLVTSYKLRTATQPKVEVKSYKDEGDLNLEVSLEVLPVVELEDLSNFQFEKWSAPIEQQEIDQELEKLRTMYGEFKEVDPTIKVKKDHQVHLSFYGVMEGKPIEGGASEGMDLEIGSNSFIPGFEDQIIGMTAGEKKEFDIDFPQDYHAEDLKGKKANFSIEVKKVREKVPADINEEFAKKMGMKSVEELKEAITEQIEEDHKYMSLITAKRNILDKFAEHFKFDIPQSLKDIEFQSIWNQFEKENQQEKEKVKDAEELENLKKEYQELADRRVRLGLLLAEIGQKYEVKVSQREIEQALIKEAMKYPGMERKVIEYYQSNSHAQATLRAPLFEDKVIELILEKSQVVNKEVSPEELKKYIEQLTQGEEE